MVTRALLMLAALISYSAGFDVGTETATSALFKPREERNALRGVGRLAETNGSNAKVFNLEPWDELINQVLDQRKRKKDGAKVAPKVDQFFDQYNALSSKYAPQPPATIDQSGPVAKADGAKVPTRSPFDRFVAQFFKPREKQNGLNVNAEEFEPEAARVIREAKEFLFSGSFPHHDLFFKLRLAALVLMNYEKLPQPSQFESHRLLFEFEKAVKGLKEQQPYMASLPQFDKFVQLVYAKYAELKQKEETNDGRPKKDVPQKDVPQKKGEGAKAAGKDLSDPFDPFVDAGLEDLTDLGTK